MYGNKGAMSERATTVITSAGFLLLGVASVAVGRLTLAAILALVLVTLLLFWMQRSLHVAPLADLPGEKATSAATVSAQTLQVISLLVCFAGVASLIFETGGVHSPFGGFVFLPLLIATFSFGLLGGAVTAAAVSLCVSLLALFGQAGGTPNEAIKEAVKVNVNTDVLLPLIVFDMVALAVGGYVETVRRGAAEAAGRTQSALAAAAASAERARIADALARVEHERAKESEAFLDTSLMLESLPDLENTLALTLLRLSELVPADVFAVFLRDPDSEGTDPAGWTLELSLLSGLSGDDVAVRSLPVVSATTGLNWSKELELGARRFADLNTPGGANNGIGDLRALDGQARSAIVAPLRTLDDFFGLIYVAEHQGGARALTERQCELVDQFARTVAVPIHKLRLQNQALTDVMTGLDNHRSFRRRLEAEVRRAHRYNHSVSLLLLDIDHFKRANDTYGHQGGDALLRQVGALLKRNVRAFDVPARYGGEEMAVILPETSASDAAVLAERVRRAVEETRFTLPDAPGTPVRLSVSLGVATLPDHAFGDGALVERADEALYRAKRAGRNRVCVAGQDTGHGTGQQYPGESSGGGAGWTPPQARASGGAPLAASA